MIDCKLDAENSILFLEPTAPLSSEDFATISRTVDPHIESTGDLAGIVIQTQGFPGWEGFGAMAAHFRFVRDHHRRIKKVAIVTDSLAGKVAEHLASHFVSAEIKRFPFDQAEMAKRWILGGG